MNHRPVCVKCQIEMRPEKNGVGVLDMADFGPYALWEADLWKCPSCSYEILTGFGQEPWAYHYEGKRFTNLIQAFRDVNKLIECWSK